MTFAIALALMSLLGFGLHGFGLLVRRAAGLPPGTWPMTVALGLAAWIAAGGVLNLARIAYPVVLYLLLAFGCVINLRHGRRVRDCWTRFSQQPRAERSYAIIWGALAVTILGFTAVTQMAPTAFNHHDDYQKYFAHAARLVQTGTLAGSPLNTLGSESLGGQTFLQAPFVAALPIAYINTADAVFCLALLIALAGAVALRRTPVAPVAILGMLLVWLFEPQYVNLTALYSGAALTFALVALSIDRREFGADAAATPPPAAVALLYAALVALKPTFALYCLLHFLACGSAALATGSGLVRVARQSALTASWGVLFIAPWVALYAPLYWTALAHPVARAAQVALPRAEMLNLLDARTLFYGGSYAQYSFAAIACLIAGAMVLIRADRGDPRRVPLAAISVTAPLAYVITIAVAGPMLAGYETALRHALPVLIGSVPAILILSTLVLQQSETAMPRIGGSLAGAILAGILIVWSAPGAWTRMRSLLNTGTMLAYVRNYPPQTTADLLAFSRGMFDGSAARRVAALQRQVPEGEPLLAWIAAPFALDFKRNPIVDVDIGGTATPWARTPAVSYVLWQYDGFSIRGRRWYEEQTLGAGRRETFLAVMGFEYTRRLRQLVQHAQPAARSDASVRVAADDGETILLRVEPGVPIDTSPN